MGFRECAAEVARYLVTIEGMDIQDPLRLRLMSHLQCFVAQRELSAKSTSHQNWSTGGYQTPMSYQHPPPPATITYHNYPSQTSTSTNNYVPNMPSPILPIDQLCCSTSNTTQTTNTLTSQSIHNVTHDMNHPHQHYQTENEVQDSGAVYTDISSNTHRSSSAGSTNYNHTQYSHINAQVYPPHSGVPTAAYNGGSVKPYRPWGAEMVY